MSHLDMETREHLAEEDRGIRPRLGGERDDGVAADDRRGEERDEAEQREAVGRDHADHAHPALNLPPLQTAAAGTGATGAVGGGSPCTVSCN